MVTNHYNSNTQKLTPANFQDYFYCISSKSFIRYKKEVINIFLELQNDAEVANMFHNAHKILLQFFFCCIQ